MGWIIVSVSSTTRSLCVSHIPDVDHNWLKGFKLLRMLLCPDVLLIIFTLFTDPNGRLDIYQFLLFVITVNYLPLAYGSSGGRTLSDNVEVGTAPGLSLNIRIVIKTGNSFDRVCLAVFALIISFTLAGHSVDHNICPP